MRLSPCIFAIRFFFLFFSPSSLFYCFCVYTTRKIKKGKRIHTGRNRCWKKENPPVSAPRNLFFLFSFLVSLHLLTASVVLFLQFRSHTAKKFRTNGHLLIPSPPPSLFILKLYTSRCLYQQDNSRDLLSDALWCIRLFSVRRMHSPFHWKSFPKRTTCCSIPRKSAVLLDVIVRATSQFLPPPPTLTLYRWLLPKVKKKEEKKNKKKQENFLFDWPLHLSSCFYFDKTTIRRKEVREKVDSTIARPVESKWYGNYSPVATDHPPRPKTIVNFFLLLLLLCLPPFSFMRIVHLAKLIEFYSIKETLVCIVNLFKC